MLPLTSWPAISIETEWTQESFHCVAHTRSHRILLEAIKRPDQSLVKFKSASLCVSWKNAMGYNNFLPLVGPPWQHFSHHRVWDVPRWIVGHISFHFLSSFRLIFTGKGRNIYTSSMQKKQKRHRSMQYQWRSYFSWLEQVLYNKALLYWEEGAGKEDFLKNVSICLSLIQHFPCTFNNLGWNCILRSQWLSTIQLIRGAYPGYPTSKRLTPPAIVQPTWYKFVI